MSKPDAPAAPKADYVDQFTPLGSMTYADSVNNGQQKWHSNITLNPQAQSALDNQLGLSAGVSGIAQNQLPGVEQQYSQPMDLSSVPQIADKAYGAMTSRLDPRFEREEGGLRNRLANQGLVAGGEAFDNEMRNFNEGKNDAYQQANLGAIQTMPQTYQLENAAYMQPLNVLNALRTGSQPQMPQFGNIPGNAQAMNDYNMNMYNSKTGTYNSMLGGMAGLGGASIMALSDRRLKENIVEIGVDTRGFGIYEYDLFGERQVGVMADEVEKVIPEAVMTGPDGYKRVNYGLLR